MYKCLFFLLFALSLFGQEAGKVIGLQGTVTATRNGSQKSLSRGSQILVNDSIQVAEDSFAKLKFLDGTLISLISGSEYTVEAFHMGSGDSNKFTSKLVKGGLRGISGSVAEKNPDGLTVETSAATMGVRGTIFTIRQCGKKEDCFYFGCDSGQIIVTNETGSYTLSPSTQRFAEFPSPSDPPFLFSNTPFELQPQNFAPLSGSCP